MKIERTIKKMYNRKNPPRANNEPLSNLNYKLSQQEQYIKHKTKTMRPVQIMRNYRKICAICDFVIMNKQGKKLRDYKIISNHMIMNFGDRFSMFPYSLIVCEECNKIYFTKDRKVTKKRSKKIRKPVHL